MSYKNNNNKKKTTAVKPAQVTRTSHRPNFAFSWNLTAVVAVHRAVSRGRPRALPIPPISHIPSIVGGVNPGCVLPSNWDVKGTISTAAICGSSRNGTPPHFPPPLTAPQLPLKGGSPPRCWVQSNIFLVITSFTASYGNVRLLLFTLRPARRVLFGSKTDIVGTALPVNETSHQRRVSAHTTMACFHSKASPQSFKIWPCAV